MEDVAGDMSARPSCETDGWMSADSARLYDFQVEKIFLGSADTMRRQALPYMTAFMKAGAWQTLPSTSYHAFEAVVLKLNDII